MSGKQQSGKANTIGDVGRSYTADIMARLHIFHAPNIFPQGIAGKIYRISSQKLAYGFFEGN